MINLQELNYKDKIVVDEEVIIPKEEYINTDIVELKPVIVHGDIKLDEENNYFVNFIVNGTMILHDSVTYDLIPYDFDIKIEETLENSSKTLDLISFLWHYIVLEVPLRFTNSEIERIENEHFRVISEEEYNKKNNPFSDFELK